LVVSRREFEEVKVYFPRINSYYAPCAVGDEYFAANGANAERNLILNLAWSGAENLKRKGVGTILEAAALLKSRGQVFQLVLAGKQGPAFADLQKRIKELDLSDRVKAVGEVTQEQKLELYAQTSLYLQPSHYEGFGLATAEAMAAGCCVIITDVGEVRTVVGDTGIYIEPGDANALTDSITKLMADKAQVAELSAKAALRIKGLFSSSAKRQNLERILHNLGIEKHE